jgi:hypothetical protein
MNIDKIFHRLLCWVGLHGFSEYTYMKDLGGRMERITKIEFICDYCGWPKK